MDEKHETTPSKPAAWPYPIATTTSPTQQGSESWLSSVDIPMLVKHIGKRYLSDRKLTTICCQKTKS